MGVLASRFKKGAEAFSLVYETLEKVGPLHRNDLATRTGLNVSRLAVYLTKMKDAGVVSRAERCIWAAVPVADWPESRGKWRKPTRKAANSPTWDGGRYQTAEGYIMVHVGLGTPMADSRGYVYEHRLVASRVLGRALRTEEQVHHRDENRSNNAPENLEVLTLPEHKVEHRVLDVGRRLPGEGNPTVACRCGCGAVFEKYDANKRPRTFVSGHNRTGLKLRRSDETHSC